MWMADSTRVGWPWCSMASWRARALITVASMPMVSDVVRSSPWRLAGGAPPDVAAADHDGELEVELGAGHGDLAGEALDHGAVDGLVRGRGGQRLARHLEDDAAPAQHVLGDAGASAVIDATASRPGDLSRRPRPGRTARSPRSPIELGDRALLVLGVGLLEQARAP